MPARGWDGGRDEVILVKEYKFPIKVMEIELRAGSEQ